MTNHKCQIQQWGKALVFALLLTNSISLSAENLSADSVMLAAYEREDMSVWKEFLDNHQSPITNNLYLTYEYGYCAYLVDKDKEAAKPYVKRFKQRVEESRQILPLGHYEMWMSAVLVFELRLHESIHPVKSMSLAKEATKLAPDDPLVLTYYGTCLFYAPKPFGSKREALQWFRKAAPLFRDTKWQYCWLRVANEMYMHQCEQKL